LIQLLEEMSEFSPSTASEKRPFRPAKVAVVYGDTTFQDRPARDGLSRLFSQLNIDSIPISHFVSFVETSEYDVIVFLSDPVEVTSVPKFERKEDGIILAFAPNSLINEARRYRKVSDAVVYCDASGGTWVEVPKVAYRLLESLLVPSMLNIDLADLKKIAKGTGAAFSIEGIDQDSIIARLPPASFTARAGLVHFSCNDDVKLKEVYAITKTIASRQSNAPAEVAIESHAQMKKYIRRINVKMGIRIKEGGSDLQRISLTAILFRI
jgi:hypothetical protein